MSSQDKALKFLLELGDPALRRTPAELLEHGLRTALALTDGDAAVVLSPTARRGERIVLYAGSAATALLPPAAERSAVAGTLAADPLPILVADLAAESPLQATDTCPGVEAGPAMFVAVRQRDPVPGYLAVYRRRARARFNIADTRSMVLLAASLGSALEIVRLSSGAEKLALSDDLTQVYNARFLRSALKRELRRASRFAQELSVVLAEVDQYETWCETNGELKGSVLLKEVAGLLAQQVRSFDLMTRFGGAQFMLVLPQTGRKGAMEVAERMRASVEANAFSSSQPGRVTASFGVASYPKEGAEVPALIASAERALARAREHGANRVESALDRAA
jgi:diguanylate cyclase (GGDEF)-like protein